MELLRFVNSNRNVINLFPNVLYGIAIVSMGSYLGSWRKVDEATDRLLPDKKGELFDFIVVGGGSAGSVVANRLSINYSVLLLEAGGEPHPFQQIPAFSTFLVNYPEIDWQHTSVPQKNGFFAQNHQESLLSAGLGLGGSSTINYLMHNRGNPQDYNNWARLLGDENWSYDSLLPFFKIHEDFTGPYKAGQPEDMHGKYGEMRVQLPDYTGMGDIYLQAAKEKGYSVLDLNGRFTEGFDYIYYPTRLGQRVSTYNAFLEPIMRTRKNLTIRKYATATKILFKNDTNEAYGIEYMRHGQKQTALAYREIILSGGAINSPKLLMQSGIGPKDNLESVSIPVRVDLPVGKNLQDHTAIYLGPFFINRTYSLDIDRDFKLRSFWDFLLRGTGPFTTSGVNAQGFIVSPLAHAAGESNWPDTHLVMVGTSMCELCDGQIARAFNFNPDVIKAYYEHAKGKESFMQLVSNGRPHARGDIKLRSSNPKIPPAIDPKYLDNEHDVRVMVEGIKKAIDLAENSPTFQKLGTRFTEERFPGCQFEEFRSDAYWECYVKQYTVSLHHLIGSCSMGKSPAQGVVDSQLKVFGTKRLRVIDASVMPVIPVANTNWPSIMVGEKGAALILQFWQNSNDKPNHSAGNSTESSTQTTTTTTSTSTPAPTPVVPEEIRNSPRPQPVIDYDSMHNWVKPSYV